MIRYRIIVTPDAADDSFRFINMTVLLLYDWGREEIVPVSNAAILGMG